MTDVYRTLVSKNKKLGLGGINNPSETLDVSGNINVKGNIIPDSNLTYSLGSAGNAWKDIYVGNNTIFFEQPNQTGDRISIGIETSEDDTDNTITNYSFQLRIKGKDDDDIDPTSVGKKIELGKGRIKLNNEGQRITETEFVEAGKFVELSDVNINNLSGLDDNFLFISNGKIDKLTSPELLAKLPIAISNITGLLTALNLKAPLLNPNLTGVPTAPTASSTTNTTQIATTAFVKTAISDLIDSSPSTLDTLNELAAALGDDANFSTTITNQLASKLSIADASSNYATITSVPTKVSDLTNDSGFVTQTELALKQDLISSTSRLNANLIHDGTVSNTEFGYLDGVTSGIQTQLDAKQATLVAGSNITITGNTISATSSGGSSSGTVDLNTSSINDLSDVSFNTTTTSNGQALIWNSSNSLWEPGTVSSSSSSAPFNSSGKMNGHIIPTTNSTYDLGSAEYKIRHLFLSNNSLWVGENHKIEVSDGKMRFRKLQKTSIPSGIINNIPGASLEDAKTILGKDPSSTIDDFTLYDWEAYSAAKGTPLPIDQIFKSDDINDDGGILESITDSSLTIAKTSGLQAALDSKASSSNTVLTGVPTAPTASSTTNTTQIATTAFVKTAISDLVDSSPSTLDTLNELAAALGDDANFSTTITNQLASKQDIITTTSDITIKNITMTGHLQGTDASFNNLYTDELIISQNSLYMDNGDGTKTKILHNESDTLKLETDPNQNLTINTTGSGVLKLESLGTGNLMLGSNNNVQLYANGNVELQSTNNGTINIKSKLNITNGIEIESTGANVDINDNLRVDGDILCSNVTGGIANFTSLNVGGNAITSSGFSGSYNDLTNKPTIPTNNNQLTNGAGFVTQSEVTTSITNSISNLVDSAPETLNTLNELAAALNDDANFSTTITNQIAAKQDAISSTTDLLIKDISGTTANFTTVNINGSSVSDLINNSTISNISDITNVDSSVPNNGDILQYNSTTSKWEPVANTSSSEGISATVNNSSQTFFDILTQQPAKFKKNGDPVITAADIVLNWSYDDILANQTSTILAKLNFKEFAKNQNLPFINQIRIDISGNVDSPLTNSNEWIQYYIFNLTSDTDDYNTEAYKRKTLTKTPPSNANSSNILNILSKTDPFDIRIYGINHAEDYPTVENRALIFEGVQFQEPEVPPAPDFVSENSISSDNQLVYNYNVSATEIGRPASQATIISAISKYSENETLSSSIYALNTTENTDTESVSNRAKDISFPITLNSLRAGTKYNYKVQVKNNIKDGYSAFSSQKISEFLRLPEDNGYSNTSVNLGINNTVSVSSPNLDGTNGSSVVYINSASSLYNLNPSSTSNQTIQITKPYGSTQQSEIVGYGKWVDNIQDLVKVECYVDGQLKQHVSFHGFNTTNSNAGTATRVSSNGNTYNFFDSPSQQDIWTTTSRRGFRIRGTFSLNSVSYSNVLTHIGAAQSTPHTIQYKYIRHSNVGGSNNLPSARNVYVDTISNDPTSTNSTTTATVQSVIYTMGIPSVKTVNIDFERTYNNINSQYQYIKGDRRIARVSNITKINKPTDKYIYLARTTSSISGINNKAINTTGSYTYTSSEFATATSSYYHAAYYNDSLGIQNENGTTLTSSEQLYSLRGSFNADKNFTVDHHFDRDSYNSYGGSSINRKLSATDFYEISDSTNNIVKLGSDVGGIEVTQYTISNSDSEHQKIPKNWTLLYYKGAFRTNASITYPNVNNYEWNSVVTTGSQYSAGTTSYALDGTVAASNSGYKWIVFKLSMSNKSNTNIAGTITYYYDVYSYLIGKGFSSGTVNKIRDPDNTDVVAFVQQTVSSAARIGNLGRNVKTTDLWYGKASNISYDSMANGGSKAAYGCRYPASDPSASSTSWGPMLDINNGNDTIYLFLGLKNSVSLN